MKDLPTLSVSIMAHPARRAWVDELLATLGPVPVSTDERPGEPDRAGMLANGANAWRMHDPAADYHIVLQDDVILCSDFLNTARRFLGRMSQPGAVSFYYGNREKVRPLAMAGLGRGWCRAKLRWGPAVCLPVAWIPDMLSHYGGAAIPHYDTRMQQWLLAQGRTAVHALPCLVDHRPGPSLIGDPGIGRRAVCFLGE